MGETVVLSNGLPLGVRSGEVIGGKYRLERELGRGAMGTVWVAQHVTLGQRVAIKFIASEHAQSPDARARFSIEAKAAARLKSRHVVQVYDDGETAEGTPYIVMEYLEGETLESRLERERELPLLDAVRVTGQVARALARAHARGIVHRDLKPANIYLARNDEDELGWTTKVLDFGIAKLEESTALSTTKTGAVLGTPLFMSPEQVRGAHRVDSRSDLYSLGACFFNMLTGRFPFDGESFGDVLVSICTDPLPDLKQAAPTVSDAVANWFKRCCAREPGQRFQSADELVEALQSAVGGAVALVQRGSVPEEFRGPSGTLRGHSAPLGPKTRALSTDDSGPFPALAEGAASSQELSGSNSASVLTLHDRAEGNAARRSRSRWLVGLAAGLALLLMGALVLRRAPSEALAKPAAAAPIAMAAKPVSTADAVREPSPPVTEIETPSPETTPSSAPAVAAPVSSSKVATTNAGVRKSAPKPARPATPRRRASNTDLGF
jgi:serine/threonine protein kinase